LTGKLPFASPFAVVSAGGVDEELTDDEEEEEEDEDDDDDDDEDEDEEEDDDEDEDEDDEVPELDEELELETDTDRGFAFLGLSTGDRSSNVSGRCLEGTLAGDWTTSIIGFITGFGG
jgi:hypothetical protein